MLPAARPHQGVEDVGDIKGHAQRHVGLDQVQHLSGTQADHNGMRYSLRSLPQCLKNKFPLKVVLISGQEHLKLQMNSFSSTRCLNSLTPTQSLSKDALKLVFVALFSQWAVMWA